MQTPQRVPDLAVEINLPIEPQRYQFVQLVRTLLQWLQRQGVSNDEALASVLRFRNSVLLSFPPSEVESLQAEVLEAATAAAFNRFSRNDVPQHIVVTPAFMGLLGMCGVMPYHYTEQIGLHMQRTRDKGAQALFDLCSNRLLALHFKSWGKYRVMHQLDMQGKDGLLPLLAAIGGRDIRRDGVVDAEDDSDIIGRYAALYRTRPISGSAIARVLADHLQVPVAIEQFVGAWSTVEKKNQFMLGKQNCTLSHGAMLGQRQWRTDLRIKINIGPIEKKDVQCFLPVGSARLALARLLRLFGASGLQYEVTVHLHPACVRPLTLTTNASHESRQHLGWNAVLGSPKANANAHTIRYMLQL